MKILESLKEAVSQKTPLKKNKDSSIETTFIYTNEPMLYRDKRGSFIWVIQITNQDVKIMNDIMCFLENVKNYYIHNMGNTTLIFISFNAFSISHILDLNRFPKSRTFQKFLEDISITIPGNYISNHFTEKYNIEFTRSTVMPTTDNDFMEKNDDISLKDKYDLRYVSESVKVVGLDIPKEVYKKICDVTGEDHKLPFHVCLSLCRISFEITDPGDRDYGLVQSMTFSDLFAIIQSSIEDHDDYLIDLKYLLESEGQINMSNLADQIAIETIDPWVNDEDVDDIIGIEEIIDSSKVPESNYIKDVEGENNNGNQDD